MGYDIVSGKAHHLQWWDGSEPLVKCHSSLTNG